MLRFTFTFEEFPSPEFIQRLQQLWQSLHQVEVALFSDILQQILWSPVGWILSQQQEQTGTEVVLCNFFIAGRIKPGQMYFSKM